jgi:hypothetical protein
MGGEPSIITVAFNETNGITNVTTTIRYASKADRDAALATGMTDGREMSYKQLDGVSPLDQLTNRVAVFKFG